MTDKPTRADLIERLIPILKRNGWGNVREYAEHIPWMLEREGLVIVEATALTADAERIAALEGEVERLRAAGESFAKGLDGTTLSLADRQLSQRICCNGWMCGCQGSSVGDYLAYELRAALKGTDNDPA